MFDSKKGMAKQLKILKMIGELSTTKILHICRHIVIGHSRVAPSLCFKARFSCEAIDRKWFFILVKIKLCHKQRFCAYPRTFGTPKNLHFFESFYVILGPAIGRTFLEENLRVLKTKKKVLQDSDEFKFRIHILYILKKPVIYTFKQHQRLES